MDLIVSTATLSEDEMRVMYRSLWAVADATPQDERRAGPVAFYLALAIELRREYRRRRGAVALMELEMLQDDDEDDDGCLAAEYAVPPGWVADGAPPDDLP